MLGVNAAFRADRHAPIDGVFEELSDESRRALEGDGLIRPRCLLLCHGILLCYLIAGYPVKDQRRENTRVKRDQISRGHKWVARLKSRRQTQLPDDD